jgi:hypothetical protein
MVALNLTGSRNTGGEKDSRYQLGWSIDIAILQIAIYLVSRIVYAYFRELN